MQLRQSAASANGDKDCLRRFKGIIHDVSRPYQEAIVQHLCCSAEVPQAARLAYLDLRPNTLQECVRQRVKIESRLKRYIEAVQDLYDQARADLL
jgi:hypothetical protein